MLVVYGTFHSVLVLTPSIESVYLFLSAAFGRMDYYVICVFFSNYANSASLAVCEGVLYLKDVILNPWK